LFKKDLFLISLINSKNIPKKLINNTDLIDELKVGSLIEDNGNMIMMNVHTHRCVLTYLKENLTTEEIQSFIQKLSDDLYNYCEKISSLDHSTLQNLLLHMVRFSERMDELHTQPFCKAKIDFQLGQIYYHLGGDYQEAKKIFEQVYDVLDKNSKEQNKLSLKTRVSLGAVCNRLGEFGIAQILLKESRDTYQNKFSDDKIGLANALMHSGRLLKDMGKYEDAVSVLKESLKIYTVQCDENNPTRAWILFRLGEVYAELQQTKEAKNYYSDSLTIHEKINEKEKTTGTQRRILWIKFRLGEIDKIEKNYEEALRKIKEIYDEYRKNHEKDRDIYTVIAPSLGDTYRLLKRYKEARPLLEDAKRNIRNDDYYGQNSINMVLGQLYTDIGEYKKACEVLKQSLKILKDKFDENHPKIRFIRCILTKAEEENSRSRDSTQNALKRKKNSMLEYINKLFQRLLNRHSSFEERSIMVQRS
jgi:tetratricopeptide (TPR) repeat protein